MCFGQLVGNGMERGVVRKECQKIIGLYIEETREGDGGKGKVSIAHTNLNVVLFYKILSVQEVRAVN